MIHESERKPKVTGLQNVAKRMGLRLGVPSGIRKVIAVHSGKGGVGKTFFSVALAKSLSAQGLKVGLLDADIDCPNVPQTFGIGGTIYVNAHKKMEPVLHEKIKIVSMGFITEVSEQALLWRGPIVSRVVEQFIHDVDWGDLDCLIVDLPPGTSDVPLTVLQILKPCEVVLVTTASRISVLDVEKALLMVQKTGNVVRGVVQNMKHPAFDDGDVLEKFLDRTGLHVLETIELMSPSLKSEFVIHGAVQKFCT